MGIGAERKRLVYYRSDVGGVVCLKSLHTTMRKPGTGLRLHVVA